MRHLFRLDVDRPVFTPLRWSNKMIGFMEAAILHGGNDKRLVEGWPACDAALTAAKVPHEGYIYPKAQHGFFNDTTPRYDAEASKVAWQRTLAWFNKYLKTT